MMVHLRGVARKASVALGSTHVTVRGVTVEALLVLTDLMHSRKGRFLVASCAIRRKINSTGSMGPMARSAIRGDFPMRSLRVFVVTAFAGDAARPRRMRLVTAGALRMTFRRQTMFGGVTRLAPDHGVPIVRVVASSAVFMRLRNEGLLLSVAIAATLVELFGMMRKAAVTAATVPVARVRADA